jgi:hypothetical protein
MKFSKQKYWYLILFILLNGSIVKINAQISEKTVIKGTVKDAQTGFPLPFVSVLLKHTTVGTVTDNEGRFSIETMIRADTVVFSFLGYETRARSVSTGKTEIININLSPSSFALDEVIVKPSRRHYVNKNNPAVDLIEKVIENKSANRKEGYDFLKFEKYDKTQFALSNLSPKLREAEALRKYQFLFDNIDTTIQKGKGILPVFIKESLSNCYYRKNPAANKEIIRGEKTINFDEYIDNKGVTANITYLYQNINIYDNNILFLTNKFLSPIANGAQLFYRYYIVDTLGVSDIECIKLYFEPRNRSDFLFQGYLYITQDSSFAVRRIEMNINKNINIDWVKDVKIVQDFVQVRQKTWMLSKDEISIDFGITEKSVGLFGQRIVSYSNYNINEAISDTVFRGPEVTVILDPKELNTDYWELNRHIPLTKSEKELYIVVDSIKKIPAFKRTMSLVMLVTTEFLTFKNTEIGPVGNFFSFNPIEGYRLRFGGRTTPAFSKKITFDGYAAYGFRDEKLKYTAGITYSLTPRTIYQFPVKSIKLTRQNDTRIPGQEFQFSEGDNFFLSLKRGVDDKILYNNRLKAEYLNEFENHFSYILGYSFTRQSPGGSLHFNPDNYLSTLNDIPYVNISEAFLNLRYAPNEAFYQGKLYRDPLPNKYPVLLIKYAIGSKSIGSDFNYSRIQLNIYKRFYFSILGYTDISTEAGKIFGNVSFPLLFIHRANQTYSYEKNAYNLMNFLEFVSDQYASVNIDHCFNGFIFNKIPLLKKLKLREIVTLKVLYGSISKGNNPSVQSGVYKFPADALGIPLTYTLQKRPYIEASIGISNILKIFRVDLIKRFTYTGNPNISDTGIRIQFRFDI